VKDDLSWLRESVDAGARVLVSERRVRALTGESEIAAVDAPEPPETPGALLGADMEWYEIDIPHYVLCPRAEAAEPGEHRPFAARCVRQREVVAVQPGTAHHQQGRVETLQRRQRQMRGGG
jgi:hypothetical protein